jgi:hypothetical protein
MVAAPPAALDRRVSTYGLEGSNDMSIKSPPDRPVTSPAPSVAVDKDIRALYARACTMGAAIVRSGRDLSATQKQALIADLKSGDQARARSALASMGTSLSDLGAQRRLVRRFVSSHPLPKDAAQLGSTVEEFVVAAKWSYTEEEGGGPAPDPTDEIIDELGLPQSDDTSGGTGQPDGTACENACAALAAGLIASALATYITASVACQALGPFGIVCFLAASASYGLALYSIDARIDHCIENCG